MRRQRTLFTFGRLLVAGLVVALFAAQASAQDWRREWVYDDGIRTLVETDRGRWTEFINGQPARHFDEIDRTRAYVELYTGLPQPTWVRIHPRQVFWRAEGDWNWRPGRTGSWAR